MRSVSPAGPGPGAAPSAPIGPTKLVHLLLCPKQATAAKSPGNTPPAQWTKDGGSVSPVPRGQTISLPETPCHFPILSARNPASVNSLFSKINHSFFVRNTRIYATCTKLFGTYKRKCCTSPEKGPAPAAQCRRRRPGKNISIFSTI